jgi:glycolate oxidase FAD binding subunit
MLDFGQPPKKKGRGIALEKLGAVIDYPARDMTITVQAGIRVAELRRLLAQENQRLPVDVPHADAATLGGILATNISGARRYGWGTLRDYVIGITVVNDEGQQVKAGGRVVKNVAGYDLCKLYIGSLGTLGIITLVTLKVVPQPEQHALLTFACDANSLGELLDRVHQSRTRPVAVEMLDPQAAQWVKSRTGIELADQRWLIAVGFESNADAVNWQVQQLIKEVKTGYSLEARVGPMALPLWQALEELPVRSDVRLTFKAAMLPSQCSDFCQRIKGRERGIVLQAHAGNGIVLAHLPQEISSERAATVVAECRSWLGTRGSLIVLRCSADQKRAISLWGPPRGDVRLMHALKTKLDPEQIFNPGRFVDGI